MIAPSPYISRNPTTGEELERFALATSAEVDAALEAATVAFGDWRRRSLAQRRQLLLALAERLDDGAAEAGRLMAEEVGKPLAQGEGEAKKCAWVCRWAAERAEAALAPEAIVLGADDPGAAMLRHDPLGPILAIMPWNFPYWQLFRFAAPALMAGNPVLMKHAPNSPRCALAIAEIFRAAGAPAGLFANLYLSDEQAAEVIADERVVGVTLTGSSGAGRSVAATAGSALKRSVLELGGSDPFLVFPDADLDEAVSTAVQARLLNNGQSCIAAKRFLVHKEVLEPFTEGLVEGLKAKVVGDPSDPEVDVGPMAREDLRNTLADQVRRSVDAGARVLLGGEVPDRKGFFYPPTVLSEVPAGCPAATEELFGPVAPIFPFRSEPEAVEMANAVPFGLGAAVWTGDPERAERCAEALKAGCVFANGLVRSDPRIPFGGVKASGWGRELGDAGLREWTNPKTVWLA